MVNVLSQIKIDSILIGQIVVGMVGLLIGIGILLIIFRDSDTKITFLQGKFKKKMNKSLKKSLKEKKENNLLYGTQRYLDRNVYNNLRLGILALSIVLGILNKSIPFVIIGIILYLISHPKEYTQKGRKLPYHFMIKAITRSELEKKDHEIMETLSILKNLMVQQKENPLGADYIINYLAQDSKLTRNAYLLFLSKLRLGQTEEGAKAFQEEIPTPLGEDMSYLLMQLDKLNPAEMEEAVISRQRYVREMRTTEEKNKDQLTSDLVYAPVIVTVLAVFMNLIVVAFWIDQAEVLSQIMNF